jgi:hypothetical protein
MASKKAKQEQNFDKVSDMGRDVFLASLGAYSKVVEDGREMISEYSDKRSELFDELVRRGEQVQLDAEARIKELDFSKRINLEERLAKMRTSFSTLKDAFSLSDRADKEA